jgi:hypothetical protein
LQQDSIGNPVDHPVVQTCHGRINGRYVPRTLHEE